MRTPLKVYIVGVVTLSAIALLVATLVFPPNSAIALSLPAASEEPVQVLVGIAFWMVMTLVASALPVRLPQGSQQGLAMAPIVAAMSLGGPAVAGWVAAIGTTEMRELRGRIPWYGSLANHAGVTLPAIAGGVVQIQLIHALEPSGDWRLVANFATAVVGAFVFTVLNVAIAAGLLSLRTGQSFRAVVTGDSRQTALISLGLAPLGWLMALVYSIQWWAPMLFA